jgi:hypothetical protein
MEWTVFGTTMGAVKFSKGNFEFLRHVGCPVGLLIFVGEFAAL